MEWEATLNQGGTRPFPNICHVDGEETIGGDGQQMRAM